MLNKHRNLALALALSAAALLAGTSLAAPTAPAKPTKTIVLCHGAWADGSSWDRVIPLLQAKGYKVVAVHEPLTSLADDVAATKRAIDAQPGEVLLVGHSYGGVVITQAGNNSKVVGLVYVAAFAPDAGESLSDLGKGQPAPAWAKSVKVDAGGFVWLPQEVVAESFAQDLSPADIAMITAKQGPLFHGNSDEKVTAAAWHGKPSWYVVSSQDRMIDPKGEAYWAKRMNATTSTLNASHVSMISKPKQIADVILAAAAAPSPARPALASAAK